MFESIEKGQQSRWAMFWPEVDDVASARAVSRQGMWACLIVATVTAIVAALGVLGMDAWAFVDAGMFLAAAWGIHRGSRFAAVGALVLFVVERAFLFSQTGQTGGLLTIALLLAFGNGARGTLALRRLMNAGPVERRPAA